MSLKRPGLVNVADGDFVDGPRPGRARLIRVELASRGREAEFVAAVRRSARLHAP